MDKPFDSPKSGALLTVFQTEGHTFVPILDEDTGGDCEDDCCQKVKTLGGSQSFGKTIFIP